MYNYINLNFVVTSLSSLFLKFQNSRSFEKKTTIRKIITQLFSFPIPNAKENIYFSIFQRLCSQIQTPRVSED